MSPHNALQSASGHDEPSAGPPPRRRWRALLIGVAVVAVVGAGVTSGIRSRIRAEQELTQKTEIAAVPSVDTIRPQAGAPGLAVVLPGDTRAYTDTPVYARTSGYLTKWYFDIGARVKQGDLLAEIDTPEIDQQLRQARADLATAKANLRLAEITATRNEGLLATHSVSTQDRDNAVGALEADEAIAHAKRANVSRLEQLQSYEKVYAPFGGIITERNTDIGALVDADANSPSKELFHIAAVNVLRIYVAVPEVYSRVAKIGAATTVRADEYPDETFEGTIVRTSNAIDQKSRTLLVEVDLDNKDGKLLPGAYVFVRFTAPPLPASVTIPSNTLLFRQEGLRVGVVRNGMAELVPITIGRDYGERVEVLSGLTPSDEVIVNPADSLVSGIPVRLANAHQ